MSIEEKRICEGVPDKLLDSKVGDLHLAEIACDLVDWESLAPYLDITESEQKEIKEDFEGRYKLQKRQALRVWRWKNGDTATYRNLIGIFCRQGLVSLAEKIPDPKVTTRSNLVLNTFYQYLLDCYHELRHPSKKHWPTLFLPTQHFYTELLLYHGPLHEIRVNISRTSLPEGNFKQVTLNDVLTKGQEEERLVLYFEGIAGSGKSTLSWYACREWAEKRLLRQFDFLIYVEMNYPQIQSANCILPDIIPYDDKTVKQQIGTAMLDRKGEGFCLLLDGLDEASTSLLETLMKQISGHPGMQHLPKLSYIMTSRPNSCVIKLLQSYEITTSRILMEGFNADNLHKFIDKHMDSYVEEKRRLLEAFKMNPRLESLCSHPINALIMTFIIHFITNFPTTQTELYNPLLCNLLVRYMDKQTDTDPPMIESLLDDVPSEIQKPFKRLCSRAYSSLLEGKFLFTMADINKDNTLDILKVHRKITMFGLKRYYSFPHLSLHEFLASIHLSKMSQSAQISAIELILAKNPRAQLLHFYAGLTRLSNIQALKLLSRSLSEAADYVSIKAHSPPNDPRPWLSAKAMTFLNCLYESQNENILNLQETYLLSNENVRKGLRELQMQTKPDILPGYESVGTLTLDFLPLTPIDCLSMGYYIRIKSLLKVPSFPCRQHYYLSGCSIDHIGIRVLFTEMKKNINRHTPCRICLNIAENTLYHVSLPLLKDLLQGQSNLDTLVLRSCFLPEDLYCALKYITEGLSNNSSCKYLDLSENQLSTSHVHHLVLMLRTSPQLYCPDLHGQDLRRGMHLLWKALQLLPNLLILDISRCNIHDPELALLQEVVGSHPKLYTLDIYDNCFTHNGLCNLLKVLVGNGTSILIYLGLGIQLNETEETILEEINQFRTSIHRPSLIPRSHSDSIISKQIKEYKWS